MGQIRYRRPPHCAFCANKPDSKEHAWPQWLIDELYTGTQRISGVVEGERARIDVTQKAIKIKCVCENCNTVWMKRLEESAQPLITPMFTGNNRNLNIPQQWTITRWAVKTAMVFEYVSHQRTLFYTNDERQQFKNLEAIPTFSHAWLARYIKGPRGFTIATVGVDGYPASPNSALVAPYFTTFVFGQLVIQVVTVRPYHGETRRAVIHPKPGPWHLNSLRIWPTQKSVAWPPVDPINGENDLFDFHRRWNNPDMEDGGWTADDLIVIPSA